MEDKNWLFSSINNHIVLFEMVYIAKYCCIFFLIVRHSESGWEVDGKKFMSTLCSDDLS